MEVQDVRILAERMRCDRMKRQKSGLFILQSIRSLKVPPTHCFIDSRLNVVVSRRLFISKVTRRNV